MERELIIDAENIASQKKEYDHDITSSEQSRYRFNQFKLFLLFFVGLFSMLRIQAFERVEVYKK